MSLHFINNPIKINENWKIIPKIYYFTVEAGTFPSFSTPDSFEKKLKNRIIILHNKII